MIRRPTLFLPSAFTALFIWLVFVIPFSIAAIEITFPLLLSAWLWAFRWPWNRESRFLLSGLEKQMLAVLGGYVLFSSASLAYTDFHRITATGLIGKLYEYALLFVIALFAARRPGVITGSARALLLAAGVVVAHCLLQQWALARAPFSTVSDPILLRRTLDYMRMVGPYKNPNDLATYLMVVGLLQISMMLGSNRRSSLGQGFLLAIVLGCLVWTQSLAAILGFLVGIGILTLCNGTRKKSIIGLLALAGVTLALFLFLGRQDLLNRLTLSDIGSRDRVLMWNTAWSMIRAHPIRGLGYNTFMANYGKFISDRNVWPAYAHNCYLQIMAENGAVGLLLFLAFLFCLALIWVRALRVLGQRPAEEMGLFPLLAGLAAGLCAFLVQSIFDTNLYALRQAVLFWTLSGLATGLGGSILKKCAAS